MPDRAELLRRLRAASDRMAQSQTGRLEDARQHLADLASKRVMTDGLAYVQDKRMDLIHLQQRLGDVTGGLLGKHRQQFRGPGGVPERHEPPMAVLGRGYAVARNGAARHFEELAGDGAGRSCQPSRWERRLYRRGGQALCEREAPEKRRNGP